MPGAEKAPQTLYDKVLQAHVVDEKLDGTLLLYIGSFHNPQVQPVCQQSQRKTTDVTSQTATSCMK